MNFPIEEKYDLINGLCRLFAEIDINGDNHMEWTEFTQFIIDAVMETSLKRDESIILSELKNQEDLLNKAHSQNFNRFYASTIVDKCLHQGIIQK